MLSDAPLKAVLFDVGGPIIDERPDYLHSSEVVRDLLETELGRSIPESEIEEARKSAVASWSPSFTKAIIWHFMQPDTLRTLELYHEGIERIFTHRETISLMDGITGLIPRLASKYKLALAGNQPEVTRSRLESTGLLKHFDSTALSFDMGLHKPDSRFFLEICRCIDTDPVNCCMIGDRLDNDIYPANILGMRTIWVRIGPHAVQHTRVPEDVPDATVEHMADVGKIIDEWELGRL